MTARLGISTKPLVSTVVESIGRLSQAYKLDGLDETTKEEAMTSERQKSANRRNAKKSTGPKTKKGKRKSSKNAIKHGILSERAGGLAKNGFEPFSEEKLFREEKLFEKLQSRLKQELNPKSQIETLIVERLAITIWRERRLVTYEERLIDISRREALRYKKEMVEVHEDKTYNIIPDDTTLALPPIERQLLIGRYQTMLSNQARILLADLKREQYMRKKKRKKNRIIDDTK